jgi:hypothetical protein
LTLLFSIVLEFLARELSKKESWQTSKFEQIFKLALFADDMTLHMENLKESTKRFIGNKLIQQSCKKQDQPAKITHISIHQQ